MKQYKHQFLGIIFTGLILVLSGCSSPKDLTSYVDVTFSGMDSKGVANYSINYPKLYKDVLNYDINSDELDEKTRTKIAELKTAYTINLDKNKDLSNGEKVKIEINVDKDSSKLIKSGSKTIEVKGLTDAKKLTSKEVEDKLVINFNGISGRGKSTIDNILEAPLNSINFTVENDGQLKNGDQAKIILTKEQEEELIEKGYVLDKEFNPTFKVTGLDVTAEKANDIKNIEDITRMIDEEANRQYKSDKNTDKSYSRRYEVKEEKVMYRQFENDTSEDTYNKDKNSGNLIKVFTVKRFSGGAEGKLEDTKTAIIGYTGIILNESGEANVSKLESLSEVKDDTYSLDSVLKLYEGYGYTEVKQEKE